jgi:hypothetical protein
MNTQKTGGTTFGIGDEIIVCVGKGMNYGEVVRLLEGGEQSRSSSRRSEGGQAFTRPFPEASQACFRPGEVERTTRRSIGLT